MPLKPAHIKAKVTLHASATDDNKNMAERLPGLKLGEIAWAMEDEGPSKTLKKKFPKLRVKDWDAVYRALTLLATTAEKREIGFEVS